MGNEWTECAVRENKFSGVIINCSEHDPICPDYIFDPLDKYPLCLRFDCEKYIGCKIS